jgi:hypothetical protein
MIASCSRLRGGAHLPAVRLDRLLERSAAVDVRDRGAGTHCVDILLRHTRNVVLRRAEMVVRVGRARVAGDRDDQLFHRRSLAVMRGLDLRIHLFRKKDGLPGQARQRH